MNQHREVHREFVDLKKVLDICERYLPESALIELERIDIEREINEREDDYEGWCSECVHFCENEGAYCTDCKNYSSENEKDKWEWDIEQYL